MDVEQVYREAVARVQARRLTPEPLKAGESVVPAAGEFRRADTPAEWLDERISTTPPSLGKKWVQVLYEIARADSAPAAVAVVAEVRKLKLTLWEQWYVYGTLKCWRAAETTATPLPASEILRAAWSKWENMGLITYEPVNEPMGDYDQDAEKEEARKSALRRAKVQYRKPWGHPAGMAV
jgi:hypothetical protein